MRKIYLLLISVAMAVMANAQIPVTVTNPTNTTPNLAASYTSLALALADLNLVTAMSGPVTLTCTAGGSETAPPTGLVIGSASLNAVLSSTNTVTINKSGGTVTVNAGVGTATPGSAAPDGIISIRGADYIIIDGLTLTDGNVANPATMEFGIGLFKLGTADGAQNNTIQNCAITLNRINNATGSGPAMDGSVGIQGYNSTAAAATTALTIAVASGTNSSNKFYTNSIQNCNIGLGLSGFASATFGDSGNDIGGVGAGTGNTILNYGGGAVTNPAAGVRLREQIGGCNVSYNTINNNNGAGVNHATTLRGIYGQTGTSASVTISNNTVTVKSGATTSASTAIENSIGITAAGNTVNIINNTITGCTYTTATSGVFTGIVNTASAASLNILGNMLTSNATNATSGTVPLIQNTGAVTGLMNISSNIINGWTHNAATSGTLNCITNSGGAVGSTLSIIGNDIQGITNSVAATGVQNYIINSAASPNTNITINTFTNLIVNTTGITTFISNSVAHAAGTTHNVNNNSIVTAYSRTGASGNVFFYNAFGTSGSTVTETNTLNNFSNVTLAGTSTLAGWRSADGTTPGSRKTVTNNTFNNITMGTGAVTSVLYVGFSDNTFASNNVSGNTISNITGGGSITGIFSDGQNQNFFNNTVFGLTSSGAAAVVTGVSITGATTQNVYKNKIYDLAASNATGTVNGILVTAGTTINIYNNLIGNLTAPAATSSDAIRGISSTSSTTSSTINVYYNTVYLSGAGGLNFGSSGIFHTASTVSTTAALNLRNNIIVNNTTPNGTGLAVAYRRSSGAASTLANYAATSNNNDFYAGIPSASNLIYSDGTSTAMTIAAYKAGVFTAGTIAPRDAASISEDPEFQSTVGINANFLKYKVSSPKQVESGAVNIATFTDDYIGTIRQGNGGYAGTGTAPDIGAWELEGIASDLSAPVISAITLVSNSCNLISRNVTATISDATGVDNTITLKPRIYFQKNGAGYVSAQGSLTSGTVLSGTWTFTITYAAVGGVIPTDIITYFIVAQDIAAPPNVGGNPSGGLVLTDVNTVTTPPTTPLSYIIGSTLAAGTYTVGTAGTYPTLTAAVADYNSKCLGGAIVFELLDASYTTAPTGVGESFPITINANADASATNTLTIRPASGVTASMSGTSASCMIILNGADYVTIDGSNNGTSSRDLTITNTNAGTSSAVVCMESLGVGLGATNNVVKNTNMVGTTLTATNGTLFGVFSGSTTISITSLGTDNDNNTIQNNNITKTSYGIFSGGASAANPNTGTVISQNVMNAASPNNLNLGGIYVRFDNGAQISQNDISVLRNDGTVGQTATAFGIALGVIPNNSVTTFTGFDVTNASVTRNKINGVTQLEPVGYSAFGIVINSVTSGTSLVANNMISGVLSASTANDFSAGIVAGGGAGSTTNIYYNSVSMTGNRTTATFPSYGLAINSGDPIVDVRNNIFQNTQTSSSTGKMYAIGTGSATFANMTSNYNDFDVSGASTFVGQTGGLGTAGTDRLALSDWQTATSKDANSLTVTPVFVSSTDLHLSNTPGNCLLIGAPISVVVDYDNAARDATAPDMGADEFTCAPLPVSLLNFSGYKDGSRNQLRWTTGSEQNNSGFEVQRSTDGINYSAIGFVNSQAIGGNSTIQLNYAFTDNNVTGSRQYYRLRQVDFDNHSKLSNIVLIKGDKPLTLMIDGLFPNPAHSFVNVLIASPSKDKVTLIVTDVAGRAVIQQVLNVETGSSTIPVDISRLANGTYMIKLVCSNNCENAVSKFVKN